MKEKLSEKEKIDRKREKLLNEPVESLICKMAVPTIISMLVTSFYNLVDTYFVGKLDSNSATAAVGLVFSLMAVIQAFGFFFGHGSGNYISRAIGRKEYDKAAKMAATGFFSALLAGTVIMVFGLIFREPLARFLGADDTMLEDTVAYMTYILIAAPYMTVAFVLNNQLRLQGNSFFGMIGLTAGAVVNVFLDPLFIITLNMGAAGAAFSTMITQLISFIILFISCQKSGNVSIHLKNFTPGLEYYSHIAGGGLPSLFRQGLSSVSSIMLNRCAVGYGSAAIAAFSIITKINHVSGAAILGFGQGFQPVCGFNYGAKRYDRVEKAIKFCIKVSMLFLIVVSAVLYIIAPQAMAVFRNDEAVIEIGAAALRYQCFALPVMGWIIIINMFLQNIQKVIPASVLSLSRQGLMFIPSVLILSNIFGLKGLELAQPAADILTFAMSVPIGIYQIRKMRSLSDNSSPL